MRSRYTAYTLAEIDYLYKTSGPADFEHHEIATFGRVENEWRFIDGKMVNLSPERREAPKIGRNDPCACGSGKKYKKCCGLAAAGAEA